MSINVKLIMFMSFFSFLAKGQDIHFSQFYENALLRNPALTGIFSGDYKVGSNYRNQWSRVSAHPFTTALVSAETRFHVNQEVADYLSFGITTIYDRAGSIDFTTAQAYAAVNYNKSMGDAHYTYLSAGFTGGYIQRSFDISKMTFANQYVNGSYSAGNPTNEQLTFKNVSNFDLGFGLSLNSSFGADNKHSYYMGVAAYHITKPSLSFRGQDQLVQLTTKINVGFGVKYKISDQNSFVFHFNYSNQKPYQETLFGGMLSWKTEDLNSQKTLVLYGGLFYRYQDALIPTFKLDYGSYSLTLSYDLNHSSAKKATDGLGGTEISIFYRGFFPNNTYSNVMKCPRFEDLSASF